MRLLTNDIIGNKTTKTKMNSPVVTRCGARRAKIQTRSMVKSNSAVITRNNSTYVGVSSGSSIGSRKPNGALLEAKRRARQLKMQSNQQSETVISDIFENAVNSKTRIRKETGIIYDESMSQHCCLWDTQHPESPERFVRVLSRCQELQLPQRCKRIQSRRATKDEILLLHTAEHYELLQSTSGIRDDERMEVLSSKYDSIYIHPSTFELSLLGTGSTIELIDHIWQNKVQNGMAIIRPPGHHAMKSEYNGYCFFNNVAVATQYALKKLNVPKIMIIDWDVHHGQGTQRFFYDNPRVLYFSIHRFEHGSFWPNLKESDFDAIGTGPGVGYNFNVPLNKTGICNGDYLAIFQQILVPVALEYQPDLIIISAGYDAALGCPEGEMEITPAFYAHLINSLLLLAESRIAVILEGGYCLDSLAEGVALTLRTLLGDPCPRLVEKIQPPCPEVQETILNCIYTHRSYWKYLQLQQTYTMEEFNNLHPQSLLHKVKRIFIGGPPLPTYFPTRDTGPKIPPEVTERKLKRLQLLKKETILTVPKIRVCYVYDELMLQHQNIYESDHPERPDRIKQIYDVHLDFNLIERMTHVESRMAITDELCLAHTRAYYNTIRRIRESENLQEMATNYNSVYLHPKTFESATMAAGSVLQVVDKVLRGESRSGVCIVRPPGHHADADEPHGFCIFNNIAIAALYALRDYNLRRVLIVDWDVHHGNGTQHIFESNPNVLYISIHRYENGSFFPKGPDGNYDIVGKGVGAGFNVNIPWNKKGMGDIEYALAFQQLIMPIAYEFDPELVLVSAGFDAAVGDPLGGCKVSPEAYGLFTHWLSALACGRIIICLEGGYNLNSISYSMALCTKALLGDPLPTVKLNFNTSKASTYLSCIDTIQHCLDVQQRYWQCLKFNKKLPVQTVAGENNNEDLLAATFDQLNISNIEAEGAVGGCSSQVPNMEKEASSNKPNVKVKTLSKFLAENQESLDNIEMYAIIPLTNCPHLRELRQEDVPEIIDTGATCSKCASKLENWICLTCFKIFCGRFINKHMLQHHNQTLHPFTLSFIDLSVWCYICEAYVDNCRLYVYKNLAHIHKFGVPMAWVYEENMFSDEKATNDFFMHNIDEQNSNESDNNDMNILALDLHTDVEENN